MPKKRTDTSPRVFKHSGLDAIFVVLTALDIALRVFLVVNFGTSPVWLIVLICILLIILNAMNYECAGHYFIHTPFFQSRWMNRAYSILNSIAFGFPQTFYRTEHLCHHRYNNDYPDPVTGEAGDRSSIYQHSTQAGVPEAPLKYAIMSAWRQDAIELYKTTPSRLRPLLIAELVVLLIAYGVALVINPSAFLLLVFVAGAGSFISNLQNWLEHAHADPTSRLTDSVSCYGRFYNFVWCNNGYHQEHHFAPGVHWTKLPQIKEKMLPGSERRIVPHAHFWNFRLGR